jgi:hypothetical protein
MHNCIKQIENRNISLFYFSTNTGFNSAGAGLATANHISPFHLLIHLNRLQFLSLFSSKAGHHQSHLRSRWKAGSNKIIFLMKEKPPWQPCWIDAMRNATVAMEK